MQSCKQIASLSDPPHDLSEEASRTWFEVGGRLLRAEQLADKMDIPSRAAKRFLNFLSDEKKVSRLKRGLYMKMA